MKKTGAITIYVNNNCKIDNHDKNIEDEEGIRLGTDSSLENTSYRNPETSQEHIKHKSTCTRPIKTTTRNVRLKCRQPNVSEVQH